MQTFLLSLWRDESGTSIPEYGMLLALVTVVVITGLTALGTAINTKLQEIATAIQAAAAGA